MVTAFAANQRLYLDLVRTKDKSNLKKGISKLIEVLDIESSLISISTMSCQKDIVDKIFDKKNKKK